MSRIEPSPPRQPHQGACRVLVVDDEPLLLRSIQRMLKQCEVVLALGGREALTLLEREQDFCVILCDLTMPEVDGLHVHDFLAHHAPALLPRMVFMSGSPMGLEWFGEAGPRVLHKPFELQALRTIVEETCVDNATQDIASSSPH